MSKERYCKFCGRELDEGKCTCDDFLNSKLEKNKTRSKQNFIVCDICSTHIESDANYCVNCGLPIHANGKIEKLQKELQGVGAPDVIEVYSKEIKKDKPHHFSLPIIAMIALATFVFGIAIGLVIKPVIDRIIRDYTIKNTLELDETEEQLPTIVDGPTAEEEIISPTKKASDEKKTSLDKSETSESEETSIENTEDDIEETAEEKKNLIDKTTKTEKTTIQVESETEETIETNEASIGTIKGIAEGKTKPELYVSGLRSIRDSIVSNGETCTISYYAPVLSGIDSAEVAAANAAYTQTFNIDLLDKLKNKALSYSQFPESIIFTEIEQKNLTDNRLFLIIRGKVTPKKGLSVKIRYRALYDRKEQTIKLEEILE